MKFDHNNISPLDNRYLSKIEDIRSIFSEYSLLKTRFHIEINWLLYLCQKYPKYFSKLSNQSKNKITKFRDSFDDKSVLEIKKIEKITNHDVKAVEYYIKNFIFYGYFTIYGCMLMSNLNATIFWKRIIDIINP